MSVFFTILLSLPAAYAFMSVVEYFLHRYPMHSRAFARRFPLLGKELERHALLHHARYYNERFTHCEDPAAKYISVDLNPFYMVLGLAPVWIPLCLWNMTVGLTFAAFFALHGLVWTTIHREMHEPVGTWFSKTKLFRYYREYHRIHHDHPCYNFNVVCPGMDYLMYTYWKP